MPKRKNQRSQIEEEEFQKAKRLKKTEYQRAYRERKKNEQRNNAQQLNETEILNRRREEDRMRQRAHRENTLILRNPTVHEIPPQNHEIPTVVHHRVNVMHHDSPTSSNTLPPSNEQVERAATSRPVESVQEHYLGRMNVSCTHCHAKHFADERVAGRGNSFNDCCSHGEVNLPDLPEPPAILRDLFNGNHEQSTHFRERIRSYNSSFAFASFNANLVNLGNKRPGPFCFKIHGQVYYQINTSLYPAPEECPSHGQLFIVDQNEATDIRCNTMSTLNTDVVQAIDNALRDCNAFAQSYKMMHEELQQAASDSSTGTEPEMQLLFSLRPGLDRRRYNLQSINEVAGIFTTTADGEIPESYVTIHNKTTKSLQYVRTMDPNAEPWVYPLLFPHGTRGWHRDIPMVNRARRVTRAAYVKYRIATRDYNVFTNSGRLFQQWIVDSYVKIEKDKMTWCRSNQKTLRADTYQGLVDHLQRTADEANGRIGKMVILPSSFTGSPRNMLQHYQDAMAIVRKFGKPDLFITMTFNPTARELQENLNPHQTVSDRPELVSRVFNLKKDELINTIVTNQLFGEVAAYVYVVEYQKRGLPHVHLLLTLKQNSKITTPDVVDKYISAEIPNPDEDKTLHNIVMKNMIHGPCRDWCKNEEGKCTKHFPKNFCEDTLMDENGYPTYRRRNTGVHDRQNGSTTDNRFVVPYNPTLLKKFNCHINVEVVSNIKAVKYLYKYIYKGHDVAAVMITNPESNENIIEHDEIRNFIDTRYVSPIEACDRIFGRSLQSKSHAITRLPVHLPNQQNLTIPVEADDDNLRNALQKTTMLMDYFTLNERDPGARNFTYSEIPVHYVFKKDESQNWKWMKCQRQTKVIGRMYSVSPTIIELFHLRLLLISVKGATSFEHLRTVDGQTHETYHDTCLALGLIEDDAEWHRAMTEGEIWMMPGQLRRLFVRILIHCQSNHPEEIWESFKDALSEDFQRHHDSADAYNRAYNEISVYISNEGSDLSRFPTMPPVVPIENNDVHDSDELAQGTHEELGLSQYEKLNIDQRKIVNQILNVVASPGTSSHPSSEFYIDGPGGSGKTFIYTTLCHLLKAQGKIVCTMAFTGIAAILLPNGKTVHKTFGMPVPLFSDSVSHIKNQSKEAQYLRQVDVFIWDEAPMAPRYALELVDRTLRDFMNIDSPFGGKVMILGGDFRQLLPVKMNATRSELVNLSIKFSPLWRHFSMFSLTKNMRTLPGEAEFAKYLLSVGDGTLNDNNDNLLAPEQCVAPRTDDIVEKIFKPLISRREFGNLAKVAVLSARNVDVDDINCRVVELLDKSTERIYTSVDSTENCDNGEIDDVILPEFLNSLNPPNFPPHELRLRHNCIVMLIRNLSISEGLCNGTRLQILELANNLLKCRILTGDKAGDIVFINRITLYCEDIYPFTFKRRQFPIKLAFAMTINKSQGQTFDIIGIDLRKDVFTHGQLYVGMSRVRSWESLLIFLGEQRLGNEVKNYVYKELYG